MKDPMPNLDPEAMRILVNERLKLVDTLVKRSKLDDAAKEISGIRKIDPKNPYALAYEERIVALLGTTIIRGEPVNPLPVTPPPITIPPAPRSNFPQPDPPAPSSRQTAPSGIPALPVKDSAGNASPGYKGSAKAKSTVVLIDDDALLLQALAELLEDNKFTAKTFSKSDEALEYLKREAPDIIICDVNLETSSFGGFTLHEKVRKLEHLSDVPFLFLSGLSDSAIVLAGKQLGADDYLTKPVEPEALLAAVKGKLKRYRQIKKNS